MKKFIDTAPFIYLIENHDVYADKVSDLISNSLIDGDQFETSVITLLEFGVKPEKENRQEIITKFQELLLRLNIKMIPIDELIAKKSYQIRAKYPFLKSMDSIQISASLLSNCNQFITNDKKLKKITEIEIILLDENL